VKVFLTGATGFLGRHLVPALFARGDKVHALVRPGTEAADLEAQGVTITRGDLFDPETLRRASSECGLVFHLAGVVSHERKRVDDLQKVNVGAVQAVLDAVEPDARVVQISSVSAFGPAASPDRPVDETQEFPAWAARFPYAASKHAGELLCLAAAEAGRDVVIANPGFLLGPGDVHGVSTWHVRRYLQGSLRVRVTGGLSNVDARDVAAGLVLLAERGRAGERTILTNRDGNLSHAEFFRRVGEVTGVWRRSVTLPVRAAVLGATLIPWPVHADEVRAASNWWYYDQGKAERDLGVTVRPLDETIADTAAQYR
jgi:dihydroflavonol-4-reductase